MYVNVVGSHGRGLFQRGVFLDLNMFFRVLLDPHTSQDAIG